MTEEQLQAAYRQGYQEGVQRGQDSVVTDLLAWAEAPHNAECQCNVCLLLSKVFATYFHLQNPWEMSPEWALPNPEQPGSVE